MIHLSPLVDTWLNFHVNTSVGHFATLFQFHKDKHFIGSVNFLAFKPQEAHLCQEFI